MCQTRPCLIVVLVIRPSEFGFSWVRVELTIRVLISVRAVSSMMVRSVRCLTCATMVCRGTLTENPCMKCYDDVGFVMDSSKNGLTSTITSVL